MGRGHMEVKKSNIVWVKGRFFFFFVDGFIFLFQAWLMRISVVVELQRSPNFRSSLKLMLLVLHSLALAVTLPVPLPIVQKPIVHLLYGETRFFRQSLLLVVLRVWALIVISSPILKYRLRVPVESLLPIRSGPRLEALDRMAALRGEQCVPLLRLIQSREFVRLLSDGSRELLGEGDGDLALALHAEEKRFVAIFVERLELDVVLDSFSRGRGVRSGFRDSVGISARLGLRLGITLHCAEGFERQSKFGAFEDSKLQADLMGFAGERGERRKRNVLLFEVTRRREPTLSFGELSIHIEHAVWGWFRRGFEPGYQGALGTALDRSNVRAL